MVDGDLGGWKNKINISNHLLVPKLPGCSVAMVAEGASDVLYGERRMMTGSRFAFPIVRSMV